VTRLKAQVIILAAVLTVAVPAVTSAAPIVLYATASGSYQNSANDPCVFYGPGVCPVDPAGWPDPVGPTNGDFGTLTHTYSGSDFNEWFNVVGTSFLLGFDVNDSHGLQTLSTFAINFYNGAALIGSYALGAPLGVPSGSNGVGYADFILAAGCAGAVTNLPGIDTCSDYLPFLLPNGTDAVTMAFGLTNGNNGPDKIFAISQDSPQGEVPEPATLLLFGSGATAAALGRYRRRVRT
jgi:hypothetical protein